jgi:ubiquinone biosynthesis accessory factor UbiJ
MSFIGQGFSATVNHLLGRAEWARGRLRPFTGQSFRIDASPFVIDAMIDTEGLLCPAESGSLPAVICVLPSAELPLILTGGIDKLMNRVRISGNAEFAEALGFVFRNLSWDVEEDLSRVVGDIPAHRLANGARDLAVAQKRALEGLGGNLAEYLTEESGMLAAPGEIGRFAADVSRLRDDTARLEKRIARLHRAGGRSR